MVIIITRRQGIEYFFLAFMERRYDDFFGNFSVFNHPLAGRRKAAHFVDMKENRLAISLASILHPQESLPLQAFLQPSSKD